MGFFDKLKKGLEKTRKGISEKVDQVLTSFGKIDEDLFEELEEKHYRYARCWEEYGDSEELGDMQGPPYLGFSSTLDVWD